MAAWSRVGASGFGFRRVDLVRLVLDGDRRWAEVIGVSHRAPCRRRMPFRVGLALVRRGAAVQIDDRATSR